MEKMEAPKSRCKICAAKMPLNHRRYGGSCCNACAAFFQRSIPIQASFVCPNSDDCLKEASPFGKHCQKCRFAKCLEIGVISREYIQAKKAEAESASTESPSLETVFAQIADTMLTTSLQLPAYMEKYLETGNPEIINISLEFVKNAKLDSLPERIKLLTTLLSKNPIVPPEFPLFCHICFCKLDYPGLPESQQQKMKALNNLAFQKLPIVDGARFLELVIISQRFLNIFNANI